MATIGEIRHWIQTALALHRQGRLAEAEALYRQVLSHAPLNSDAVHFLGLLTHQRGDTAGGIELIRKSIQLSPGVSSFHTNLGEILRKQGQLTEAEACFRIALRANANNAQAHQNLATVLAAYNRVDDAIAEYRHAIRIDAGYALAHHGLSLMLLLSGQYTAGWEEYEWRLRQRDFTLPGPSSSQPVWIGESIAGKTLLLRAEQGFGDTIHFIRYAKVLADRGIRVAVNCQPELMELLRRTPGVTEISGWGEPPPACDFQLPLMSVARLLKTSAQTIPGNGPYVMAEDSRQRVWAGRLTAPDRSLKIGLCWAGNAMHLNDRNRSSSLAALMPLLQCRQDSVFFSLQKGPPAMQIAHLPPPLRVTDLAADLSDFSETAAAIASLDLVITVDTAIAHLSAAMGKPTWIFLPFSPDWRWGLNGTDSPWYPTVRLFRQTTIGDWTAPIEQAVQLLQSESGSISPRNP